MEGIDDKKPGGAGGKKVARAEREAGVVKPTRSDAGVPRGPRQGTTPSATPALEELTSYKIPRKNSGLSDSHSVASDDSAKASVHSAVSIQKRQSGGKRTLVDYRYVMH